MKKFTNLRTLRRHIATAVNDGLIETERVTGPMGEVEIATCGDYSYRRSGGRSLITFKDKALNDAEFDEHEERLGKAFADGLVATGFEISETAGTYLLGEWTEPDLS